VVYQVVGIHREPVSASGGRRAQTNGESAVVVMRGREVPASLWPEWKRLVSGESQAGFWEAPDWYAAVANWLEEEPDCLYFFCVLRRNDLEAVVPLRYEGHGQRWVSPLHPHANVYDMVAPAGVNPASILRSVVSHLEHWHAKPWRRLEISATPLQGKMGRALVSGELPRVLVRAPAAMAWFDLRAGQDPLVNASGRFRRNLRRLERRLRSHGEVRLEVVGEHPAISKAFEEFLRVEAAGWKGKRGTGSAIDLHPRVRSFYKQVVRERARYGGVRIHLLRLGDHVIAAQLAMVHGDVLSILKIAYDESYADLGPGAMVLYLVLRRESECRRFRRVSLVTDPQWARPWGPQRDQMIQGTLFNRGVRGVAGAVWETGKRLRRKLLGRDDTVASSLGRFLW